ncbi:uncharacterized protein LOC114933326 [Nylanderia fulva]|uniref:uncharacterized protein LOC114933326 n=1 Tax=Nylanderia fulva TaxID=613905 RepID=UPI0010FBBA63|nr:uncharacterized protein LOC114933326 [Nylanderia fulva]XP_029161684.1 uncharacterized protein LOC114933326 [Nylanderia fulva]
MATITKQDNQVNENKNCSSGTKVKRKSRSARRRLNAMMSNASFHFSDTDSEGELTTITNKIDKLGVAQISQTDPQCSPLISVTGAEDTGTSEVKVGDNLDYLIADGEARSRSRRGSFAENLTDVDEIYSDEENDPKRNLKVANNDYEGETDLEDMEGDEDIQPTIYVTPRSDILNEFGGEMITTKEGNGPFSVEVRNRLSREEVSFDKADTDNVPNMPNTDSEDMEGSEDEDKLDEAAACSHYVYNDMYEDILTASQTVMSNKKENTLHVPDVAEEAISDCHTDVEDVD